MDQYSKFFLQKSIFSYKDFLLFCTHQGIKNKNTQNAALKYYLKTGRLFHLKRGLYAVRPALANRPEIDFYLLAAKLVDDAVLAYHTALELHGVGHSVFEDFTYITSHFSRPFIYDSHVFRGVSVPKSLQNNDQQNFGVITIKREGQDIRVTSLARTLIDVLSRPELSGGWEEVWRSLESIAVFDIEEAVQYTLLLNNATLAAKVGFFLEKRLGVFTIERKYLNILNKRIPSKPFYLERGRRRSGKLIKKWNLIVPEEILKKSWEEPNEDI